MLDFGDLSKKTVHIGVGGGRWIEVPMLTVGDYDEFNRLQSDLMKRRREADESGMIDAVIEARRKLAELACKVMPPELHERLRCWDYVKLAQLVLVLCTGDDNGEDDDPQKKTVLPSQAQPL